MKKIYFTPGPSQLYFTVEGHLKSALKEQIPSISHRGNQFKDIIKNTTSNLKELLGIPDNFQIVFTYSATEVWERLIQNCVSQHSHHLVNGAFSGKFYKTALQLGIDATASNVEHGNGFSLDNLSIPKEAELIGVTHNETSTGVAQPMEDIYALRKLHPKALIAIDVVSSAPYVELDFSQIDSAYFSVQKCFGLPPGLGVWIVNDRCINKARQLEEEGKITGSYHRLTQLAKFSEQHQTPSTPNMLSIYLLSKVTQDMLVKGILQIRRETDYKAAVLYHMLSDSSLIKPFVSDEKYRSKTTVVAEVISGNNTSILSFLNKKGFVMGTGYGEYKKQHIRIANFPTHSKEQIELLSDLVLSFEASNN